MIFITRLLLLLLFVLNQREQLYNKYIDIQSVGLWQAGEEEVLIALISRFIAKLNK